VMIEVGRKMDAASCTVTGFPGLPPSVQKHLAAFTIRERYRHGGNKSGFSQFPFDIDNILRQ
jgi:hypothetical protein